MVGFTSTLLVSTFGFWDASKFDKVLVAGEKGSLVMDFFFLITLVVSAVILQVAFTILGKALKVAPSARGLVSGAFVFSSSLATILTDTLGLWLFNKSDRAPFVMCCFFLAGLTTVCIVLRCVN